MKTITLVPPSSFGGRVDDCGTRLAALAETVLGLKLPLDAEPSPPAPMKPSRKE